jgi:RNA polymerase sigma factor (sigma-70 family)
MCRRAPMSRGAEGGPQSLASFFQRYRKRLVMMVARIVQPHDIEDIVQDTYLRLYKASQKQQIRHPKSFMLKIARNLALNHVGRADAMNHLASPAQESGEDEVLHAGGEESSAHSADALAQAEEEFLIFCRAVRELPLQCRRAFILRKVYDMSQREVAQQLGICESTVEKHIAKGLAACSAYMKQHGYARPDARSWRRRAVADGRHDE